METFSGIMKWTLYLNTRIGARGKAGSVREEASRFVPLIQCDRYQIPEVDVED